MNLSSKSHDLALLVLRLAVGGLMLLHGIAKLRQGFDAGLEPIQTMLGARGLPESMALGVYVGEVLAPVLLIVGMFVRPAALVVAFTMLMSIFLAYSSDWYQLNEYGGLKVELNLLYFAGAIALFFAGGGDLALKLPRRKRELQD